MPLDTQYPDYQTTNRNKIQLRGVMSGDLKAEPPRITRALPYITGTTIGTNGAVLTGENGAVQIGLELIAFNRNAIK
jgi:hypothetical protein